jgi:hypothetical protein
VCVCEYECSMVPELLELRERGERDEYVDSTVKELLEERERKEVYIYIYQLIHPPCPLLPPGR